MRYRKLGNTGYDVGLVGFGLWQLAGGRWQVPSRQACIDTLIKAKDSGVNLYDAAMVYGQYKNEQGYLQSRALELLGEAFQACRDEVIYCIKFGQMDEYSHLSDYTPKLIIQQFEQAKRQLKTDFIDIALIHAPSMQDVESQRAITILETLKAQGFIRAIGYSFENEPQHALKATQQPIDVMMLQYNLLDQQCAEAIDVAEKNGIGVIVGGGLKRGYLSGRYQYIEDIPIEDDYWRWNVQRNPEKVKNILQKVRQLEQQYGNGRRLRQAALDFVFAKVGVSSCVIGHRQLDEVIANIEYVDQSKLLNTGFNSAAPCLDESNDLLLLRENTLQ